MSLPEIDDFDSAFIILDEPTASLDPIAESNMYKTFQSVLKNRGCIMISHRLASAKLADKIIVIKGGKIYEYGTHAELMNQNGLYHKMFIAQSSWYSEDGELGREFGGAELSGGQWQKLAIARGLFKKSELIVLDEPTSALDPLIETEILSRFIEIAKEKTTIIISHRVGLCKLVDRIIVMKDGKISEVGTHNELIIHKGEYHRLYTEQGKWYN